MKEALDCYTNSSYQHPRKCTKNSMENMKTVVRVSRVNQLLDGVGESDDTFS